jgi:hypothetical protein
MLSIEWKVFGGKGLEMPYLGWVAWRMRSFLGEQKEPEAAKLRGQAHAEGVHAEEDNAFLRV